MLARKIFFYLAPPVVVACLIVGMTLQRRRDKALQEPQSPPIVEPATPEESPLPQEVPSLPLPQDTPTSIPQENAGRTTPAPKAAPAQPEEKIPLSEAELLAKAPEFSNSPIWAKLLGQASPALNIVKAIDALANGERPVDALDFLHVDTPFAASQNASGDWIPTPASYERYQAAVDFVDSLDPQKTAHWFELAEPILQQACKKIGYQDKPFRTLLTEACNTILTTPRFDFNPQLIPTGTTGTFHFQDPAFEQLNDAQKLLIRLGPTNCAKIQAKCEAIADALELYK